MANLVENLTTTAARYAARPALRVGGDTTTYAAFDEQTARVAGLIRSRGLELGDPVGVMLPNVPQFAVIYYGLLRAGCVVVPMNVLLKSREVTFHLKDSGAKLLFAWHEVVEEAEKGAAGAGVETIQVAPGSFEELLVGTEAHPDVVQRADDDIAMILYTSGTTGTPKGAELTHRNLAENARVTAETVICSQPEDVILGALPLFHAFGQTCALNASVYSGSCLSLLPRFDPGQALEILHRDRVTVFVGVPTMYSALLHHPDRERFDTTSLRICLSGGAALPVEVLRGFDAAFDCKVLEGYGLSETSPVASFNHPDRVRKPGSVGTPIRGVEMKVIDEEGNETPPGERGEIAIKGHNVMRGYRQRPDATREAIRDGWFRTGDVARVDEDGYFFIVDRKKDLIIRGGYNVYPREIEEVLYEHPAVREAAVVGIADERLGEEVGAAVVLNSGESATAEELRDFVKSRIAAYKYPRKVWLVDTLPKGPTGKILKLQIAAPVRPG